ncbi:hypothetical protein G6M88_15305 [Agrobacterium rubi]|uniref:Uncharacterized protein n=1 Tax=Agrobacterium rubi TaxID=28099 RepID=A0AAE7URW3_9HYPH|nr:hypothetical protein [Agrobacterium rubi]NTF05108.1 hypothetical protein [Agrobacterium rubi]QTG01842.1 hypothetical protein G6M88_15305 [Agrobacterium rubi]
MTVDDGFPSRLEQIDLPLVLKGTLTQGHPKPGMKPAGMDAEQAAHHSHRKLLLMLGNERVIHFASLARYAVAFLICALLSDTRQLLLKLPDLFGLVVTLFLTAKKNFFFHS